MTTNKGPTELNKFRKLWADRLIRPLHCYSDYLMQILSQQIVLSVLYASCWLLIAQYGIIGQASVATISQLYTGQTECIC